MKNSLNSVLAACICLLAINFFACKDKGCPYTEPCIETCELFENFEDDAVNTSGNWMTIDANATIQAHGGSNTLYLEDLSGGSNAFNIKDFPHNLLEAGCALNYDVEYEAGSSNATAATNSIQIFQGTDPVSATLRAVFVLNTSSAIVSGAGASNISVPLELATGTTLPSNAFGAWVLVGGSTPSTAADIANFNTLIQNIDGVNLAVDNGGNPAEQWWYDNFCFKQCCD